MVMIAQQDIGVNFPACPLASLAEQFQEKFTIEVIVENFPTAVASIENMIKRPFKFHP